MTHIVLENIPNTPEGKAFLKQLRKYLRPEYKLRSRGRHRDRKGLAKQLVKQGEYCDANDSSVQDRAARVHQKLRAGMSCKHADRITTVVEPRTNEGITKNRGKFYLWYNTPQQQGPFKNWYAALVAKRITKGF
jgi:hypothetical protein